MRRGGDWRAIARRLVVVLGVLAVLLAVFAFVPLPSLEQLRALSAQLGGWFPLAFFALYAVGSALPIPRSTFTYSAAVLFAPMVAIPMSLGASTVAAVVSFIVVRKLGYARTQHWREHPRAAEISAHLERRGWAAVLSLRMVPAVPFSLLSYVAALSPIRLVPFVIATVIGSAPGTIAAVMFGDSLTTGEHGWGLVATAVIAILGVVGLILDAKLSPTRVPASR